MGSRIREHVQMYDVKLYLYKEQGGWYDCVVQDGITLTREANVAAKVSCSIRRDAITAEKNDLIDLKIDGVSIFFGVVITTRKMLDWADIEAYDQIWYLARNQTFMGYAKITAAGLIENIVVSEKYKLGHVTETGYVFPYRALENTTYLDAIQAVLEETRVMTGQRYVLFDDCRKVCLETPETLASQVHMRVYMSDIESYSYDEDLSEITTEVTVKYSEDRYGTQVDRYVSAKNKDQYKKYGKLSDAETAEEGENPQNKVAQLIKDRSEDVRHLSITGCQGDKNVRGGTPIWVDFYTYDNMEYIRGWFRVDSVTHHFNGGFHTMDMETTLLKMHNDWNDRSGQTIGIPK